MSSPLISENFSLLMEPKLRKIFIDQYKKLVPIYSQLFNMQKSSKQKETDYGIGSIGDFTEFNGKVQYDTIGGTYSTEYTHTERTNGIQIQRSLYDDDQYGIINKLPQKLAISAQRTMEKLGASVFNLAFTYEPSTFDSAELCASDHASPNDSNTQSNEGTAALSPTALWDNRNSMKRFRDDKYELIGVNPDTLLVPLELESTALEIINSKLKPLESSNTTNILTGNFSLTVWQYLTDSNNWFLIDKEYMRMYLNWFTRIPLEFTNDKDSDTYIAKYNAYFRCSQGWSDWRWIMGNLVS